MRSDYCGSGTVPEGREPWAALRDWIEDARAAGNAEPEAMCLATCGPSARFVLLRGLDRDGLRFFTNYASRKGGELAADPRAEACFWWPEIQRQVRARGTVEQLSAAESDAYFASRPLESRFSAAASAQSRPISSREELEAAIERLRAQYPDGPERPSDWGGFLLVPNEWEFWIGKPGRLHERHSYVREGDGWTRTMLAP